MINDYKEAFEKTKTAGLIAAGALDEVSKIAKAGIRTNQKDEVLIIDDLIATGGTAEAAAKLVEISEGRVAAFVFVINLFDLGGSDNLVKSNYKVENLIEFPGH